MYSDTNGFFFLKHQYDWPNSDLLEAKKTHLVPSSTTYAVHIIKMNQSVILLLANDSIYSPINPWQFQPLDIFFNSILTALLQPSE